MEIRTLLVVNIFGKFHLEKILAGEIIPCGKRNLVG